MGFLRSLTLALAAGGLVPLLACSGPPPAAAAGSGEEIFKAQACNVCHSVSAAGIESKMKTGKMKGPDLTPAVKELEDQWIHGFITQTQTLDGRQHPKKFTGSDDEFAALVAWLRSQP